MRKLGAILAVTVALAAAPHVVSAAPILPPSCDYVVGPGPDPVYECDLFADYDDGVSELGVADGNLGSFFPAYTLLLTSSADLSDGIDSNEVAHILRTEDQLFTLYSNLATVFLSFNFSTILSNALAFTATQMQVLGCDTYNGVTSQTVAAGSIGYCQTSDVVTLYPNHAFGNDILRINTALPIGTDPGAPIPEPGTMGLVAFGSAALAAIRRRRARRE
jgi:hypothetical protein